MLPALHQRPPLGAQRRYADSLRDDASAITEIEHFVNDTFDPPKPVPAKHAFDNGGGLSSLAAHVDLKDLKATGGLYNQHYRNAHEKKRGSVHKTAEFPQGLIKTSLTIERKEPMTRLQHYYEKNSSSKRALANETPNGIAKV